MNNFLKSTSLVALLSLASTLTPTSAEAKDLGLGIVLGQPTGLSLRVDMSPTTAFDAALAWRLGDYSYLFGHADHLWFKPDVFGRGTDADFYYGVGVIVALPKSDFLAALRLPVGLTHKFKDPSIEIFGELAVAFTVVPDTDFDVVGGVGARYWF